MVGEGGEEKAGMLWEACYLNVDAEFISLFMSKFDMLHLSFDEFDIPDVIVVVQKSLTLGGKGLSLC